MYIKNLVLKENPVIFYRVDENGTLNYLMKKKDDLYEVTISIEDMHVSIGKNGNTKTGDEWLLNTLPGEHEIEVKGRKITNFKGSCKGICSGCESHCYAINGARQHHNSVLPSNIKNLLIYRFDPERYEREIRENLNTWKDDEKVFRWHASGEIEDYNYFLMMIKIALDYPEIHFYTYTKRFDYVERYFESGNNLPDNFIINLSVWEDNLKNSSFDMKYIDRVQRFEWKDNISKEDYYKTIHCRSVDHTGKKKGKLNHDMNCKNCGLCWKGKCKGKTIIVYNH